MAREQMSGVILGTGTGTKPVGAFTDGANLRVLYQWLDDPATKAVLRSVCRRAVAADVTLRLPNSEEDSKDGMAQWRLTWRKRLGPEIGREFKREFPEIAQHVADGYFDELVGEFLWPQFEHEVVIFGIRGIASRWAARNLGDGLLIGDPDLVGGDWVAPLYLNGRATGSVVLDRDGAVLARSSNREDILKQIPGNEKRVVFMDPLTGTVQNESYLRFDQMWNHAGRFAFVIDPP